ncbi:hypothetical protein BDQ17DRAFT_1429071 [Cyathus striatus]|nr:hypothetical protein BDQ17DRAFT_1429071 [Cyathus striatus]
MSPEEKEALNLIKKEGKKAKKVAPAGKGKARSAGSPALLVPVCDPQFGEVTPQIYESYVEASMSSRSNTQQVVRSLDPPLVTSPSTSIDSDTSHHADQYQRTTASQTYTVAASSSEGLYSHNQNTDQPPSHHSQAFYYTDNQYDAEAWQRQAVPEYTSELPPYYNYGIDQMPPVDNEASVSVGELENDYPELVEPGYSWVTSPRTNLGVPQDVLDITTEDNSRISRLEEVEIQPSNQLAAREVVIDDSLYDFGLGLVSPAHMNRNVSMGGPLSQIDHFSRDNILHGF